MGAVQTILIVDDHPSFRLCARETLESEGLDVIGEADNGAAAIEAVGRLHPDAVLLDVDLPDMTGFDVTARLARNGEVPAVVLVSSRDAADYGPLIEESGARGFIAKAELSGAAVLELLR
jgi:DNA-binding NarL/FixJ family response regulator